MHVFAFCFRNLSQGTPYHFSWRFSTCSYYSPFLKAYLITLVDSQELVARVARRFMPRLKIESEVATMRYLRDKTDIPVPTVYHYDSNPYNRLGGEFILMSKACASFLPEHTYVPGRAPERLARALFVLNVI